MTDFEQPNSGTPDPMLWLRDKSIPNEQANVTTSCGGETIELQSIYSNPEYSIVSHKMDLNMERTISDKKHAFGRVVSSSLKNLAPDRDTQIMNVKNKKYKKMKSSVMAVYVGLLTAVGGFLYGYDTGMINGLLEMNYVRIHFSVNGIAFSSKERAILTAIMSLGTFVGSLLAPLGSDKYGRKRCMVWTLLIVFNIGIVLQMCYENFGLLLAGRFITGIGVGVISSIVPLFQAEISPRWIRGSIISFYQWAITWGLLISSAITQGTRNMNDARCYRIPTGLQFVWSGVLFAGLLCLPESPRFYVMKNDLDGAIISLSRLRRLTIDDDELIEELVEIKASHDYELSDGETSYLDCFRSSSGREHQLLRMMTCVCLQTFQQSSGINFIFYYGVNFFVGTGVSKSYLMSFVTYAVNVVFSLPGILLVDRLGRRKLLIGGALGMAVSNFIIAIVGLNTDSVISNKVMLAFVCLFIAFFASSWGPVVWVVTGELFSLSIRQKGVSLSATTNWIVNFVFAYSTPYIIDQRNDTHGTLGTNIFFLWGTMNICALFVVTCFVYETKGLMLEEVNELYRRCPNAFRSEKMNLEVLHMDLFEKEKSTNLSFVGNTNTNTLNNVEMMDSHSKNNVSYQDYLHTDDMTSVGGASDDHHSMSPMDYLREWDEKNEKQRILSDNILAKQSLPSFLDAGNSEQSADNGIYLEGNSEGVANTNDSRRTLHNVSSDGADDDDDGNGDSSDDYDDSDTGIDPEISFNFGLYGDENVVTVPTDQVTRSVEGNDEESYKAFIAQVAADLSEHAGVDVRPRGSGSS